MSDSDPERHRGSRTDPLPAEAATMDTAPFARELGALVPRFLVGAGTLVVLLWFLHQVRWGVLLLLVALIIAIFLNAPVAWLEKRGVSRRLATLLLLLATLTGAAVLGWLMLPRLAREIPRFLELLPELGLELMNRISSVAGESPELERQLGMVVSWALESIRGVWRYASNALETLVGAIVVFALVLFILLDPRPILSAYLRLLPLGTQERAVRAFARSSRMVVGWVAANVIVGGIRGTAAYIFLAWMGIPGALLWGVLSFVTALIPRVGFYLMTIPPVLVAAADGFQTALWTALFFLVLDEFLGNFVVPRIQGETMELHPAYILAMTVLMALAFGVVGVLIAAPVAGIIKAHIDEFYLEERPEDRETKAQVSAMLVAEEKNGGAGAAAY